MDLSIVIPTYNEADNLGPLLAQVFRVLEDSEIHGEVIIVDDDSPDRTWERARRMRSRYPGLRVIRRTGDRGLSTAVLAGLAEATSDRLMVMDADLSHPPKKIADLHLALEDADVAVGSRYVKGGGVANWPLSRKMISRGATLMARVLTEVKDPMSGFFALHRRVIDDVDLDPRGYKILLEVLVRGNYDRVREVPFVFSDREAGESKLSSGVCRDYLAHIWKLFRVADGTRAQLARFLLIGGLGILVNLAVLWALVEVGGIWYLPAAGLSFMAAVTFNFAGNKTFAFRDRRNGSGEVASQYSKFVLVSVASLAMNLAVLFLLVDLGHIWYMLGQVIAIISATAGNFAGNKFWTFHGEEGGSGDEGGGGGRLGRGLGERSLKALVLGPGDDWGR